MGIFDIFKKKEKQVELKDTVPQKPPGQIGMNRQEVINCITSGKGNCEGCESMRKCIKQKRQLKKIGVLR
jgi:hypothetical protein